MRFLSLFLFVISNMQFSYCQNMLTANELLLKSIEYHDPKGKLSSFDLTFDFIETRPNGADRSTTIKCNLEKEIFSSLQSKDSFLINSSYDKGIVKFLVNESENFSEEIAKELRLTEERFLMLRNYYQYLWLLPVKLLDSGTIIHEEIKHADFFGKASLEMKVTYDPSVGNDIWYFYFHPNTYALIGYRFYHDEAANDGEYILLDGEMESNGVKLPKERKWYMHKDDKFLGADILDGFKVKKCK